MKKTAVLATCLLSGVLLAQGDGVQDAAQIKRRLAQVQMHLSQVDQQMARLAKRRKGVWVELQAISLQAEKTRAHLEGARIKRDAAQGEVQQIVQRKEHIQKEMARLRKDVKRQVRWSLAQGPLGGLGLAPSTDNFEEFLSRGRYLDYWHRKQQRKLSYVDQLKSDLISREKELKLALDRLAQEERESAHLQASLRTHEEKLQAFLIELSQDEDRQKQAQAELAEEALQLERMLAKLLGSKPAGDAFEPARPFVQLKGKLPQPAPGRLAQPFGEHVHPKFKTRTQASGLLISTRSGADVQAVADGRVLFADSYQSYGPMVVLDHGQGYFSLYTHLGAYHVRKDQVIRQGESVGSVSDGLDGARLGFEIRYMAQPQDPQGWLKQKY